MTVPLDTTQTAVTERHIRFVDVVAPGDVALASFTQPGICYAVIGSSSGPSSRALDLVVLGAGVTPGVVSWAANGSAPVSVKYRGVDLLWRPGRAVLQCEAEQVDALVQGIVEFAHYEGELRRIEAEVASAWVEVDRDKALAFDVTVADLRSADALGARMAATFGRRIRLARMEALLFAPDGLLPAAAQKLGLELRERAGIEARVETLDGQIEVFEHVYEMASQRLGEFRAARQGHIMELIIIVLLAAEAVLMLAQTVWRVR